MKKLLTVFILLTILLFSFSACAKNSDDTSNQNVVLTLSKQSLDLAKGEVDSVTANLTVDGVINSDVTFSFALAPNYPSGVVEFSSNGAVFTVVAIKAGNVKINCVAVYKGKEYSSTINISTVNERVELNDTIYIEYGAGDVFYLPTSIAGAVTDVKYQGESVFNGYVQKTRSVIINALNIPLGIVPEKLSIYAMGKEYRVNAEYIGMIVNDAEEFFSIQDIAYELGDKDPDAPTLEGIFYLGNDIVIPNGKTYVTKYHASDFKGGFRGVIDGRGYKVDGLHIGDGQYLFHSLLGNGGIRNIAFVNSVKSGTGGFLCYLRDSELTNVYLHFKRVESNSGTYLLQRENHGKSKTIVNVMLVVENVVDITSNGTAKLSMGTIRWECLRPNQPEYCRAKNCIFVCPDNFKGVSVSGLSTYPYPSDQYLVKIIPCVSTLENLTEKQSNWDTNFWTVTNGIPQFNFS